MKLDRVVILAGVLAGLIPVVPAQDLLPQPGDPPPLIEDDLDLLPPIEEDSVTDPVNPGSAKNLGPSQVIGEGGGTRLLHYRKANPVSVKPSFFHRLVAATADGRRFQVYHEESRSPEPVARMNDHGDVATVFRWSCVRAFFAPNYRPVNIRKLRSDRFLKASPQVERFTIRDIAWGEGVLVCGGHLTISGGDYPFLSRLLFNDKGEVSDHQILWTTWKPGTASQAPRNPAASGIPGSLHQQGSLILWRNAGPAKQTPPKALPPGFDKSTWQCTDLTTGTTRLLAETDPVDRTRLEEIERGIEKAQAGRKPPP